MRWDATAPTGTGVKPCWLYPRAGKLRRSATRAKPLLGFARAFFLRHTQAVRPASAARTACAIVTRLLIAASAAPSRASDAPVPAVATGAGIASSFRRVGHCPGSAAIVFPFSSASASPGLPWTAICSSARSLPFWSNSTRAGSPSAATPSPTRARPVVGSYRVNAVSPLSAADTAATCRPPPEAKIASPALTLVSCPSATRRFPARS